MLYSTRKTISQILKLDQSLLIQKLINLTPTEHQKICSPFRNDRHPNCYFEWFQGKLRFIDWATAQNIDVIGMCQLVHNCNLPTALEILYDLYYFDSTINHAIQQQQHIVKEKVKFDLTYTTRNWTELDKIYWSRYGISTWQLDSDNVYSVQSYTKKKNYSKTVVNHSNSISYALQLTGVKIYNPLWTDEKWITTCSNNDIGNHGFLDDFTDDRLIITKSYKDSRVIRNLGYNCIWTPNEGQLPNEETINEIVRMYNNIFVLYDNDNAGILSSDKLVNHIKHYKSCNVNSIKLDKQAKDSAETYVRFGSENLMSQLQQILGVPH